MKVSPKAQRLCIALRRATFFSTTIWEIAKTQHNCLRRAEHTLVLPRAQMCIISSLGRY
jgi:hypothetical protein